MGVPGLEEEIAGILEEADPLIQEIKSHGVHELLLIRTTVRGYPDDFVPLLNIHWSGFRHARPLRGPFFSNVKTIPSWKIYRYNKRCYGCEQTRARFLGDRILRFW